MNKPQKHTRVNQALVDLAQGLHPAEVAQRQGQSLPALAKICSQYKWQEEKRMAQLLLCGQRARMGPVRWELYCRLWEIAMGQPLMETLSTSRRPSMEENDPPKVRAEVSLRAILAMFELTGQEPLHVVTQPPSEEIAGSERLRARIIAGLKLLAEKESQDNAA